MFWRKAAVVLSAVAAAGVAVPAAHAADEAATSWQATVLPRDGRGSWVTGTDGRGEYSGSYLDGYGTMGLAIWTGDGMVVVDPPAGCTDATAMGESSSGVIAVHARGCGADKDESAAFVYLNDEYHRLTTPDGFANALAVAINTRGDVLGEAGSGAEGEVTVVWSAAPTEPEPVVIPDTLPGQRAVDLDEDGTVLFTTDNGPSLWRDGTMTPVAVPDGYAGARGHAISGGVVVGDAYSGSNDADAFWWPTPSSPLPLAGATSASAIDASGLTAGGLTTWQDGEPAGSLPTPTRYDGGRAIAVGDDGSVLGVLELHDDGGKLYEDPVVWRRTG